MKIKLIKPHWHNGTFYEAGTEVDVDSATYDFITQVNQADRAAAVAEEKKVQDILSGRVVPAKAPSKGAVVAPQWVPPAETPDPAAITPNFGQQPQPATIPGVGPAKPQEKNLAEKSATEGNKQ